MIYCRTITEIIDTLNVYFITGCVPYLGLVSMSLHSHSVMHSSFNLSLVWFSIIFLCQTVPSKVRSLNVFAFKTLNYHKQPHTSYECLLRFKWVILQIKRSTQHGESTTIFRFSTKVTKLSSFISCLLEV